MSLITKDIRPLACARRTTVTVCRGQVKSRINEIVDKRRMVDKQRIERIKEIGNTLDHIAKSEVKSTMDIIKEFMPFLSNMKNFKPFKKHEQETLKETENNE